MPAHLDGDHTAKPPQAKDDQSGGFRAALAAASDDQPSDGAGSPSSGAAKKDAKTKKSAVAQAEPAAAAPVIAPAGTGGSLPLPLQLSLNLGLPQAAPQSDPAAAPQAGTDSSAGVSPVLAPSAGLADQPALQAQTTADPGLPALPEAAPAPRTGADIQPDPIRGHGAPQADPLALTTNQAAPTALPADPLAPTTDQTAPAALPADPLALATDQTAPAALPADPLAPTTNQTAPPTLPADPTSKATAPATDLLGPTPNQTASPADPSPAVAADQTGPRIVVPAGLRVTWNTRPAQAASSDRSPGELSFALRMRPQSPTAPAGAATQADTAPASAVAAEPKAPPVRLAGNVMPLPPASARTDAAEKPGAQPRNPQPEPEPDARNGASPAASPVHASASSGDDRQDNGGGNARRDTNRTVAPSEPDTPGRGLDPAIPAGNVPAASAPPADTLGNPLVFHADKPAEPAMVAPPAPPPAPTAPVAQTEVRPAPVHSAQEISVSVASNDDQKVEIRLVERAGEVHVSVRTSDETLAHTMREDLGSLTGKLAQNGFSTEPVSTARAESSSFSNQRGASENQDPKGGQQQGSRQGGGSSQQQSQQEGRNKRPAWLDAMESSLAQNQPKRSTTWQLNR